MPDPHHPDPTGYPPPDGPVPSAGRDYPPDFPQHGSGPYTGEGPSDSPVAGGEIHGGGAPAGSRRGRVGWALAAALTAAVVLVLILGFVWPKLFVTSLLDTGPAETSIAVVLTDNYRIDDVGRVSCPDRIEVDDGGQFTCDAVIAGTPVPITATFTGSDGDFRVADPGLS